MQRKILHIIGAMDRAGAETWLLHVLRAIDRSRFEFHFLVHTNKQAAYDDEIRSLGAHIHHCGDVRNPVKYGRQFKSILRQYGPFEVVHSHVYLYSGYVMRLAAEAGVPIRIAHSHTAPKQKRSNLARLSYDRLMRSWIRRYSTERIGVSRAAADGLFGNQPAGTGVTVLHYGLDFTPFFDRVDIEQVKSQFGIPPNRKVIGHVGRFAPVKNHSFLVDVFERVVASGTDAHLLLVGDGPLLPSIRANVETRGLSNRCTFAGLQSAVSPLLSAMNVFVFPSLHEGLPLSILEAQAAGVPVIASIATPEEIDAIPNLIERMSLEEGAEAWAAAVKNKLKNGNVKRGDEALILQKSSFALPVCVERLSRIYAARGAEI
jgi:glycosyltransferase involved in cell wall biosynthesis